MSVNAGKIYLCLKWVFENSFRKDTWHISDNDILSLSYCIETNVCLIHPEDLWRICMYSVGGMLMQRKHTLCVPPSELTVKDIESAADPDKCFLR